MVIFLNCRVPSFYYYMWMTHRPNAITHTQEYTVMPGVVRHTFIIFGLFTTPNLCPPTQKPWRRHWSPNQPCRGAQGISMTNWSQSSFSLSLSLTQLTVCKQQPTPAPPRGRWWWWWWWWWWRLLPWRRDAMTSLHCCRCNRDNHTASLGNGWLHFLDNLSTYPRV